MTAESAQIDPPTITNKRCFIPFSAQAAIPSDFIHGTFKGEPSITIPKATVASLAARFENTLIGKFSQGKPPMDMIRKFLSIQNFTGAVLGNLLDKKHVVFRFEQFDDYVRFFSKPIWNVYGKSMRILKWTPDFDVDREPSIVPIWICLPRLPIHLVNPDFIFSLVSSFSKPLKIDSATEHLRRPSVARVQVEFDLLEMIPSRIWIQNEAGRGFWQPVLVEDQLPPYCKFCWHIGHEEHFCTIKYPDIRRTFTHTHDSYIHTEFRPKKKAEGVFAKEDIILDKEDVTIVEPDKLDIGKNVMIGSPTKEDKVMEGATSASKLVQFGNQQGLGTTQVEGQGFHIEVNNFSIATDKVSEIYGSDGNKMMMQAAPSPEQRQNTVTIGAPTIFKAKEHEEGKAEENSQMDEVLPQTPALSTQRNTLTVGVQTNFKGNGHAPEGKAKEDEVDQEIVYSEGCSISNPYEILSMPSTTKSSGKDNQFSIQDELRYMNLDPKAQLREYISEKDFEETFTPAKKSTRIRKQKQIFDL